MAVAAFVYLVIAGTLLLRLFMGLAISLRLLRDSRVTGQTTEGVEIRESTRVQVPVTLGIMHPAIVLPTAWRKWERPKLDAVLAHERSHVWRRDPALQFLSLIHRALLWHSPLSWFLHKRIVQTAEDVSDEAAVAATGNRVGYAQILLDFMEQSVGNTHWPGADCDGVAMARYGLPEDRIHRIVHGTTLSRGITRWSLAAILAIGAPLSYLVATAQQARPEFEIADIHVTPPRADGRSAVQVQGIGAVRGGRYEIHNATMMDLITTAYGVEAGAVIGGPSWLALDRFDVIAKPPDGGTAAASIHLMLQSLLEGRFKLVVREATRPLPAWVLSKGPREPKLKLADSSAESTCRVMDNNEELSCRNVTMDAFVARLREDPRTRLPFVNSTGIEGYWDFDLNYPVTGGQVLISENHPILDAIDKQLGLNLELQNIPQPVLIVETVNRRPTANALDIQKRLPPDPVEFEVASIRPCEAVDPRSVNGDLGQRSSPSGLVTTGCQQLRSYIVTAWDLCPSSLAGPGCGRDEVFRGPGWLNSKHFNIVAKAPIPMGNLSRDLNYRTMLRNLLVDRFKMVTHYEDRVLDVYELVAAEPKLRRADPSSRTGCQANTGGWGTPTILACQNVTMAQFADEISRYSVVNPRWRPIVDASGIQDAWDVTLTFGGRAAGARRGNAEGVASDPTGSVTVWDAIEEQLGLKLKSAKRPVPVFVIDHIEETPTDN
jgi:uncharacterized protein (TIGR03435 family)